jgi:hypothetical protein
MQAGTPEGLTSLASLLGKVKAPRPAKESYSEAKAKKKKVA